MSTSTANMGGLVTGARPIAWQHLSKDETDLIELRADPWIKAVVEDSKRPNPAVHEIDEHRTGRVLFIDGVRGAGKTSFLLTLLKHWTSNSQSSPYRAGPHNDKLHIFLPVLDFDPLPRGMPLHGWLLEPWRKMAQDLDRFHPGAVGGVGAVDLTEQFAELFERAVLGWTPAHHEGKSVIDKALAYQERSSGWLETYDKWKSFVGAMVCKKTHCVNDKCDHAHEFVFVITIDDVDLQVEHLPDLLHAIRLFHHSNVAYVLTGNHEHLRFALLLDYIRRHDHLLTARHLRRSDQGDDQALSTDLWNDINKHSKRLCDAFLEKALPQHALVKLEHLSLNHVLGLRARDGESVRASLDASALKSFPPAARELPIVTARKAQYAVDEILGDAVGDASTVRFVAALCGTGVVRSVRGADGSSRWQFTQRGRLTTQLGTVSRAWEGRNRLTVLLADRPRFFFFRDFKQDRDHVVADDSAHAALLIQLAVEGKNASALALNWAPDELILATEVRWQSLSPDIEGLALFHWPVLARPTASEVLELGGLVKALSEAVEGEIQTDINEKMLVIWLSANIGWRYGRDDKLIPLDRQGAWDRARGGWFERAHNSLFLKDVVEELAKMSGFSNDLKDEVTRWATELTVMTAPYFGLPEKLATDVRTQLMSSKGLGLTQSRIKQEQDRTVRNAIIAPRTAVARLRREPLDQNANLTSSNYDDAVKDFLDVQRESAARDEWWTFLKSKNQSQVARKRSAPRT